MTQRLVSGNPAGSYHGAVLDKMYLDAVMSVVKIMVGPLPTWLGEDGRVIIEGDMVNGELPAVG